MLIVQIVSVFVRTHIFVRYVRKDGLIQFFSYNLVKFESSVLFSFVRSVFFVMWKPPLPDANKPERMCNIKICIELPSEHKLKTHNFLKAKFLLYALIY